MTHALIQMIFILFQVRLEYLIWDFHSILFLNSVVKFYDEKNDRLAIAICVFFYITRPFIIHSRNINQLKLDSISRLDETFIIVAWLSIYFKKAFYLDSQKLHVLNQVMLTKCSWAINHQIQSYINPFYMYMYDLLIGER